MEGSVITLENITALVKPLTKKYHVKEIYLFGSYARGEADENSDLDFLVFGGEGFKLTSILALGDESWISAMILDLATPSPNERLAGSKCLLITDSISDLSSLISLLATDV